MPFTFKLAKRLALSHMLLAALLALGACEAVREALEPPTSIALTQLVVRPESVTVDPTQTISFHAYGRTQAGDSVAAPVTWSATAGSITPAGLYTADTSVRDVIVTAALIEPRLTASAQVRKRVLVAVALTPATASLPVGGVQQFGAYGMRSTGDSVGVAVTYSASGGTITTGGLYTAGQTPGSYRVVASEAGRGLADTADVTVSPATVESVAVSPASASLTVGQTVQLGATLRDASGNVLSGRPVTWSSSASGVATVSGSGVVTAVAAGSATITATSEGQSGTAAVTVTNVPVASVTVSPASASLTVGQTVQLGATLRDASGNMLSGRPVTWSSSAAGVATVSGSGVVTAVAVGSATITAASEGQSGTAAVTVTAGSVAGECAAPQPGWIWCDDFEQDRLGAYFEYDNAGGGFVRAAGVGVGGSSGMRARFGVGQVSAGSLHLAFGKTPASSFRPVDAGTALYRDVYWRLYVRAQTGWVGGGGYKLSRAISFASANWAEAMIAHVWGDPPAPGTLLLDPVSGTDVLGNLVTTRYNDFANLRWLGASAGVTPLFAASHVGQWYCVEAHARLNDAGLTNGVFEFWVNGALEARKTGLNWLGAFSLYGINAVFVENYWNTGAPAAQERYLDNVVVSTQRIGC